MKNSEKVYWLADSDIGKAYKTTTWYRCVGGEDFLKKVEEKYKIVAIIFEGNNVGFVLDDKD